MPLPNAPGIRSVRNKADVGPVLRLTCVAQNLKGYFNKNDSKVPKQCGKQYLESILQQPVNEYRERHFDQFSFVQLIGDVVAIGESVELFDG